MASLESAAYVASAPDLSAALVATEPKGFVNLPPADPVLYNNALMAAQSYAQLLSVPLVP
jgi:hypothetical protein